MAFIKCPECGKRFSETEHTCPYCGCPGESQQPPQQITQSDFQHQQDYQQQTSHTLVKCDDCGLEYDGFLMACPNCGCPTEYQTKQVEQSLQEPDCSQDILQQTMDDIKVVEPRLDYSSITTMEIRRCPACNAPLSSVSYEDTEIVCEYCGQRILFVTENKDRNDEEVPLVLMPRGNEKDYKTTFAEKLVMTDHVPVNVFDSLNFDTIRRNFYPIYVFDVNWSAKWSAVFSHQISHQEPTYDINGKRTGTHTVFETEYRDANGTSAGDAKIVISGLSDGFSNQYELCEKYSKLLLEKPNLIEKEVKKLKDADTGWKKTIHNLNEQDAWGREGKQLLAPFVDSGVNDSVSYMSNGYAVEKVNYTYRYHENVENKLLVPIWETDFSYRGKSYTASVDAWQNVLFMKDYPQEGSAEDEKTTIQKKFKQYKRRRTWGCILFGVFYYCFVILDMVYIDDGFYIAYPVIAGIAAILTWIFMRKTHQKIVDLENSTNNKYWIEKKDRQAAAQRKLGISISIGEEPRMRKMSYILDITITLMTLIFVGLMFVRYFMS